MENLCIFYVEWDSIVSLFHILLINVSVRFTGVENHNYFLSFFIPKSEAPGRDCAVIVGPMLFIVCHQIILLYSHSSNMSHCLNNKLLETSPRPNISPRSKGSSKILIFAQVRTDLPNGSWISCCHERFSDKL